MQEEYKIIFTQETTPIISGIIQKFGLKGIDEDFFDKLEKGESFIIPEAVILDLTIKRAGGEISDKEMVSLLKEYLEIAEETAKYLAQDIEIGLVSITKKVLKTELVKKEHEITFKEESAESEIFTKIKPPIGMPQIGEIYKPEMPEKKLDEQKIEKLKEVSKKNNKEPKKTNNQNQSDSYRESIQ